MIYLINTYKKDLALDSSCIVARTSGIAEV